MTQSYAEKVRERYAARAERLPKWARDYIAHLERRAVNAEAQAAEATAGPADSNVFREWGLRHDDQPIGRNAAIRYKLVDGRDFANSITVRIRHDDPHALDINGDCQIAVEPRAGNSIRVRLVDR